MLYRLIKGSSDSTEHSVICLDNGGKYVSLFEVNPTPQRRRHRAMPQPATIPGKSCVNWPGQENRGSNPAVSLLSHLRLGPTGV